ncbi:MAG TPA: hypothetical protein VF598_01665 [Hymenobacter sp.]|jgi:hypothetical protein
MAIEVIATVESYNAASYTEDMGKVEATRVFKIELSNDEDKQVPLSWPIINKAEAGLPAYNSPYDDTPYHANTLATSYTPKYEGDSYDTITVEVGYTYNTWLGTSPVGKTKFSTNSKVERVDYFKDSEGKAAVTTAGEPFPQYPQRNRAKVTWKLTRNVEAIKTRATYEGLMNKLNQDAVTIEGETYAIGTLLTTSLDLSEVQQEAGFSFKVLTLEGEYEPAGFNQDIDSRGYKEKATNGALKDIAKGNPLKKVETPWPLDNLGKAKASASDEPAVVTLKPYLKTPMGSLFAV